MRKCLFILMIFLILISTLNAQDYTVSLHAPGTIYPSHYLNPDGTIILASIASSDNIAATECIFFVTKLDVMGQVIWVRENRLSFFTQGNPLLSADIQLLPNGNYRIFFEESLPTSSFFAVEIDGSNGSVITYKRMPDIGFSMACWQRNILEENEFTRIVAKYHDQYNALGVDTTVLLKLNYGLTIDNKKLLIHPNVLHERAAYIRTISNRDIIAIKGNKAGSLGTLLVQIDPLWQTVQESWWIPGVSIWEGLEMPSGELYFSVIDHTTQLPGILALYPDFSLKWYKSVLTQALITTIFEENNVLYLGVDNIAGGSRKNFFGFDPSGNYVNHFGFVTTLYDFPEIRRNAAGNLSFLGGFIPQVIYKTDDINNISSCNEYVDCLPVYFDTPVSFFPEPITLAEVNPIWDNGALLNSFFVSGYTNDTCFVSSVNVLDPIFQLDKDTLCLGDSIYITGTPGNISTPLWNINGTVIPVSTHDFYYTPLSAGNYTIQKIVYLGSCVDSSEQVFTVLAPPVVSFNDTTVCYGQEVELNYTGAGQVLWPDGSSGSQFIIQQPGTYTVQVSLGDCTASSTFDVNILDVSFTVTEDSLCEGDSVWIQSNMNLNVPYTWTLNNLNLNESHHFWLTPPGAGTFRIDKWIQEPGCIDTFSILVHVLQAPLSPAYPDTIICAEQSITYTYPFPGVVVWPGGDTGPFFTINTEGNYTVTIDNDVCETSYSWNIDISDLPSQFLPPDTIICNGAVLELEMPSGWNNNGWNDSLENPILNVTDSGYYFLTLMDEHCTSTDSIWIDVDMCIDCEMFMPNSFTPNQDIHNPVFLPVTNCRTVREYIFRIFDRWGKEIFYSGDLSEGWDGEGFPIGVYVYRIDAVLYNGLTNFSYSIIGKVNLLR